MRKLAIAMALASTALATPAMARDDAWYIGVESGVMLVEDIDLDIGGIKDVATVDTKYGFDVDGLIGYDFGMFRAEAEVGYKHALVDEITAVAPGIPRGPSGDRTTGNFPGAAGSVSALSFMVNGLLDFGGEDDGLAGFVGGGVGVARVKYDGLIIQRPHGGPFLDDSDTGFAWQVIAGVRAPLTDNIDVGVKYRFFNVDNVDLVGRRDGLDYQSRFRSHSLLGSFIYNFGAPAPVVAEPPAPTPPPPEPTPPPPVVEQVCTPGPYIVFFEWDKSDITPEAASILDNAVTAYGNCGQASVMLAGHADRSGSAKYNVGLSERRNASTRAYLESRGIPSGVISTQAFGESKPRVETADGVRELQNRRVEITYGPGAGM